MIEDRYFAPDGTAITMREWAQLWEQRHLDMSNDSWWRRRTVIDDEVEVSSIWLGLNYNFGVEGPPLIWETMIFYANEGDSEQWRYPSRQAALDHHEEIVRQLRTHKTVIE